MIIPSPVTGNDCKQIDSFDVKTIIDAYKKKYNIDVSSYFINTKLLPQYQCTVTGLKFFYPHTLAGNGEFYSALENFDLYYADWKWDYEKGFELISENSKVLDIGCGRGSFLEKIKKEKKCTVTGLEFNPSTIEILHQKKIEVYKETIESFAPKNKNRFDVVCFFQVLEHISNVKSFISSAVEVLKPNGKMIVAVPYNKPYMYGNNKYETLNLPPHHMGWWDETSLQKLENHFNIKFETYFTKPFRDYNSYLDNLEYNASINNAFKHKLLKLIRPLNKLWIQINRNSIPGGYILAVYTKNNI
jgi:2-polyprenyl-3-methyl-5-hydroxy-6-metoxy-1,4-benzoquinol methylase